LRGYWLGRRRYAPVRELMRKWHLARSTHEVGDLVFLVEHEPVITLGRGTRPGHLLASPDELGRRGIDLFTTDRGGDITLHAPGQLVIYPIVDLAPDRRDVRRWVGDLAEVMRRVALGFGVDSGTVPGLVGLWADRRAPGAWTGAPGAGELAKLGAIGVRISRWITLHGCALNLSPDLGLYRFIVPCGIGEHGVTSVAELSGRVPDMRQAAETALGALGDLLDAAVAPLGDVADRELERLGGPPDAG
jgi:lipoyl(octanoyl) transferase